MLTRDVGERLGAGVALVPSAVGGQGGGGALARWHSEEPDCWADLEEECFEGGNQNRERQKQLSVAEQVRGQCRWKGQLGMSTPACLIRTQIPRPALELEYVSLEERLGDVHF